MRTSAGVVYLHSDHLGSTSATSGASVSAQTYYAFGNIRSTTGTAPTDFGFTGQRRDASSNLMYYGARYYDSVLGRFISADTIVPQAGNPQSLNRYAYVLNNSVKYVDPSGHDPLDEQWVNDFYKRNGKQPTEQDMRDRLFSLLFAGSGENGSWTTDDWGFYYANRDRLWRGLQHWPGAPAPSLERFIGHLNSLAAYYQTGEEDRFVSAVGFIWAGIPPLGERNMTGFLVGIDAQAADRRFPFLNEGIAGWNDDLTDDEATPPDFNPSHHYSAFFYAGYFSGRRNAEIANWVRDSDNHPDIMLGNIGASHGAMFRWGIVDMGNLGAAARFSLSEQPGIWANPYPGQAPWWWGLVQ